VNEGDEGGDHGTTRAATIVPAMLAVDRAPDLCPDGSESALSEGFPRPSGDLGARLDPLGLHLREEPVDLMRIEESGPEMLG
jgi:hypothetical protein